jgi:predicted DNA-binding protein YlxM (UPF0122 family)
MEKIKKKVVYFHRRKDTNEVFYVGIGKLCRPYQTNDRNKFWKRIVNKVGYNIEIIHTDLTWDEAIQYERKYIKQFGRRDMGLGTLVNMTDGGEGNQGQIFSEETRKKISISSRGRNSILTDKQIIQVREDYSTGDYSYKDLGNKYGVQRANIYEIVNNRTFKYLQNNFEKPEKSKQLARGEKLSELTDEIVLKIREVNSTTNLSQYKIAKMFGVSRNQVYFIIKRLSWTHI